MRAAGRVSRVDGRRETIRASSPEPPMTYPGDTKKGLAYPPHRHKAKKEREHDSMGREVLFGQLIH
jgi:hypothetical protein